MVGQRLVLFAAHHLQSPQAEREHEEDCQDCVLHNQQFACRDFFFAAELLHIEEYLDRYFDLAGCHGDERERARVLAPREASAQIGWYVLHKPGF